MRCRGLAAACCALTWGRTMRHRDLAIAHLRLRLQQFNRVLHGAVQAQVARAARLARPDLTPYCISQEEALCLLDDTDSLLGEVGSPVVARDLVGTDAPLTDDVAVAGLRARAAELGVALPLDVLGERF